MTSLSVRRLVNIDAVLHPFELVLENYLSVGDTVIEEVDHIIVCTESSDVLLELLVGLNTTNQ